MTSHEGAKRGILFVLSAPSGAGKTTVASRALGLIPGLRKTVSHTTRPIRDGETDGVDYHFVDTETFDRMVERGEFIEWARVHGASYGTSHRTVEELLGRENTHLLLVIDVQGAETLRHRDVESRSIFLLPPSMEELERRLLARGADNPGMIKARLEAARGEIEQKDRFDYVVVNDNLDTAVKEVCAIITAETERAG